MSRIPNDGLHTKDKTSHRDDYRHCYDSRPEDLTHTNLQDLGLLLRIGHGGGWRARLRPEAIKNRHLAGKWLWLLKVYFHIRNAWGLQRPYKSRFSPRRSLPASPMPSSTTTNPKMSAWPLLRAMFDH
jgi:hypothetical protein